MNTRVTSFNNFDIVAARDQWIGGREQQEDSYGLYPAEDSDRAQSFLAVLADGMGGVADGEKASKHLVDSFLCTYSGKFGNDTPTTDTLVHCISYANQSLADLKKSGIIDKDAGATFIAMSFCNDGIRWLNVGDSLLYRQHGKRITKINTAHTWQWELDRRVSKGEMTPEEAAAAPGPRHALYSAVCGEDYLEAELVENTECCVGDRFIISSDGLMPLIKNGWEEILNNPEIRQAPPDVVCDRLLNKLRLLHVPNQDNTSIIVIDVLPKVHYTEHYATVSLIGNRDSQQDNEGCWKSDKAMLAVVADGAGGHAGGERASRAAVDSLRDTWEKELAGGLPQEQAEEVLREAMLTAHREVIERSGGNAKFSGKCAIVALYLCNGTYTVANVGDCRAYLAHKSTWKQLTIDDSLLRILVARGEVSPEEARNHPDQSCLTQALGTSGKVKPHVSSGFYTAKDRFLLCCDGLWNQLPEQLWNMEAWQASNPEEHNKLLADMAQQAVMAAAGKSDNVSAIWLHTLPPPSFRLRKIHYLLTAGALLLCLAGGTATHYVQKYREEAKLAQLQQETATKLAAQTKDLYAALLKAQEKLPEAAKQELAGSKLEQQEEMQKCLASLLTQAIELKKTAAPLPKELITETCKTLFPEHTPLSERLCAFCQNSELTADKLTQQHILELLDWTKVLEGAKAEAERKAREEEERKAKEEAERKAAQEAAQKAQAEAEREEAERKAKEDPQKAPAGAESEQTKTDESKKGTDEAARTGKPTNENQADADKKQAAQETLRQKYRISTKDYIKKLLDPATGPEVLRLLIVAGVDVNAPTQRGGESALHWAAGNGESERVEILLSAPGIDVNRQDKTGKTPLHWAAEMGHIECVKLLLAAPGIDPNLQNRAKKTPHQMAEEKQHRECADIIRKALTPQQPPAPSEKDLESAHRELLTVKEPERLKQLLALPGIDVNYADESGFTPLYCAIHKGRVECTSLLLAAPGIDVNKAGNNGTTPLIAAAVRGNSECMRLLLAAPGIDVNKADKADRTPLNWAAGVDAECVRLLLAAPGIDVNKADNNGVTPLQTAEANKKDDCATLIRAAGGN